jgi:hypothetical protein
MVSTDIIQKVLLKVSYEAMDDIVTADDHSDQQIEFAKRYVPGNVNDLIQRIISNPWMIQDEMELDEMVEKYFQEYIAPQYSKWASRRNPAEWFRYVDRAMSLINAYTKIGDEELDDILDI